MLFLMVWTKIYLWLNKDESISDFNITLCNIANTSFALGERMFEEKLAKKILRFVYKKFNMKVKIIE